MRRLGGILGLLVLIAGASAQQWSQSYEEGLKQAQASKWTEARAAFKQAIANRPEDTAGPTVLPGPITDRRTWRDGAPYSPNFLAAYAGYKGSDALQGADRTALLGEAAAEFEAVLKKGQNSPESFYFLNAIYVALGKNDERDKLEQRLLALGNKANFKVDREGITPQDQALVSAAFQRDPVVSPPIDPGTGGTTVPIVTNPNATPLTTPSTRTPIIPTKYALIIGNSESQIPETAVAFGGDSAQAVREALLTSCGYAEENVELVINATKEQILTTAAAMAERMPRGATLFLYFAGVGANLDNRDYLAGVDSQSITESSSMVAKADLYRPYMDKEAKIFAFYEAARPFSKSTRCFGSEIPRSGHIAQMQSTMPGMGIASSVRASKTIGLFTDAMVSVFTEERSNQFPISEFGWKVFYKIRGGQGGGGSQTPTLPVRVGLDDKAKF